MPLWTWAVPPLLLAVFFALYKWNRHSLAPSFVFTAFLFALAAVLSELLYGVSKILLVLLLLPFIAVAMFGAYVLIGFLFLNARAVLKREGRTLAHCLPLIFAALLVAFMIAVRVVDAVELPAAVKILVDWVKWIALCYFVHVTEYIVATILCNLSRPRKDQDYIIVHGAALAHGEVSPLLAKRVDKAIDFYRKQEKAAPPPKLILSGGKGSDESRSEAEAMAAYAMQKGIPQSDILLEDRSVNTLENMRFSKQIMETDSNGKPYRAIYATSAYHLLRTGIYARRAGLRISGIGAKTAFYYIPSALLREYIAYIVLYRKWNIAFAAASLLLSCGVAVLVRYFT